MPCCTPKQAWKLLWPSGCGRMVRGASESKQCGLRDFKCVHFCSVCVESAVSKILGILFPNLEREMESVGFRLNRDSSNPRLMVVNSQFLCHCMWENCQKASVSKELWDLVTAFPSSPAYPLPLAILSSQSRGGPREDLQFYTGIGNHVWELLAKQSPVETLSAAAWLLGVLWNR